MTNSKRTQKTLIAASAGFVAVMLLISVTLFWADEPSVKVESRNIDNTPVYSLEDVDVDEALTPLSQAEFEDFDFQPVAWDDTNYVEEFENAQVPEPASITVLTVGAAALLRRRRRRRNG